jgi:hypothetical protein
LLTSERASPLMSRSDPVDRPRPQNAKPEYDEGEIEIDDDYRNESKILLSPDMSAKSQTQTISAGGRL